MAETAAPSRPGTFRVNARGWTFLVLTGSTALAAALKGNNLLFAIFSVLAGILVVSAVLTFVTARKIDLARALPEAATAGELFPVGLRLRNRKNFWPAFCLRFDDRLSHDGRPSALQPSALWLPLARARQRVRGTFTVSAQDRGWAEFGPLTVTSEFTPGLFTYTHVLPVVDRLLVYPRRGVLNRRVFNRLLSRAAYVERPLRDASRGEEEFAGVRDYRPGDSPRRVHWKMSARVPGRLLVREMENPRIRDASILLETYVPNPGDARRRARLERAVSFAASLAEGLLVDQYHVRFRTFAPDPVDLTLDRRGALDELLRVLALLKGSRFHRAADLLGDPSERRDEITIVLRISDDPLPEEPPDPRRVVLGPREMKDLLEPLP